jgi:hypothetical protein
MPPQASSARNFTVGTPAARRRAKHIGHGSIELTSVYPVHGVNLRMSLLKGIHDHHFSVEIASEVGGEHRVLASGHDSALRVDEQGADSVISAQRRH